MSSFEAARALSTAMPPARDSYDWTGEMIAVSRQRDRASFMRIYNHFMPRVCLYLRGLGAVDAVAEDLAQEALLRLWQRADMYDPQQGSPATWLFRIARNLHIDRVRREPAWVQVQEDLARSGTHDEPPRSSSAEDYVEHASLKRRIDDLSAVQARLMRMSYFEAKTHQEIAAELGMPLGTVKSHLRRAFLRLQNDVRGEP